MEREREDGTELVELGMEPRPPIDGMQPKRLTSIVAGAGFNRRKT